MIKGLEMMDESHLDVFREIGNIIIGCVSGRKIVDESKFTAVYLSDGAHFRIVMAPKDKRMRHFIGEIVFTFSTSDYNILSIDMKNGGGDLTTITFSDKKINKPIDSAVFKLQ